MLTAEILLRVFPRCADPVGWTQALEPALLAHEITSPARLACFLAQVGHESGQFNRLTENLSYRTPQRLMAVWPRRFRTVASAQPYVNKPRELANLVYALRLGNGSVASGDGYRFRGRGLIQVTGRSNYAEVGRALALDLVAHPEWLEVPVHAARSAAWYWQSRGLNALADDRTNDDDLEDFREITRRINGGLIGVADRLALLRAVEAGLRPPGPRSRSVRG